MTKTRTRVRPSRANVISSLQLKLNGNKKPTRLVKENYDTKNLIVLPQMRTSFDKEELELLGTQLDFIQLHPITVRRCTEKELRDHIKMAHKLFPYTIISFKQFKAKQREDGTFDVLVAGERRFRAYQTLPEWNGKLFAGIYQGLTSHTAFFLQQVENTAKIPEREEESNMIGRLYHLMREKQHKITLSELAILINRSPSYTSDLVRFSGLPDYIRWFFEKGLLSYSTCIQVGRLEGTFEEKRIQSEILHIISSRMNTDRARKYVQKLLEEVNTPTLFADDFQAELDKAFSNQRRKVVGQELAGVVARDRKYVGVVARLLGLGLIGKGKPYSEESPKHQLGLLTSDIVQMLPVIRELYNSSEFEKLDDNTKVAVRALASMQ